MGHKFNNKPIFSVFLGAIIPLLLASCSSELDSAFSERNDEFAPLVISVTDEPIAKATGQNVGTSLSDGAEIGVFVTASDGAAYDGKDYSNVKFRATGTGVSQTWAVDENTPVLLSSTKGKVFAYYPRQESGVSLNSIPISNDGNDWMYTPVASSDVSIVDPSAQLCMEHAMTIVRVKVVAGNELSNGTVSRLTMDGSGWATSATIDLFNGKIGSYAGEGTQFVADNLGSLTTAGVNHEFWMVSNETASVITFRVTVGSDEFKVSTPSEITLNRGKIYNYTITVENLKDAVLSSVVVADWSPEPNSDLDQNQVTQWSKLPNGVYAIDNDGDPVAYETASLAPTGTYQGVAVVMKGKAFEVAKENAAYTTWAATKPMTDEEISYFSPFYIPQATETIWYGYLKKPDGTYYVNSISSNQISYDISTWTSGALADVDGMANTDRILAANVTIASVIRSYNDGSHGYTDWYLPAAGQLAYMFMNYDKIDNMLAKVNGAEMSLNTCFWSSSVCRADGAWRVAFSNGGFYNLDNVTHSYFARLVRDI